ncbi:MAG: delta-60 repeat domain-containing protein, partial [Casimicrobium sp.]
MLRILGPVLVAATLCWSSNASAAPGDLDTSFGSGSGKVITAIGPDGDVARAIAVQPDGKIVVAGGCVNSSGSDNDFCLARYLPSGALDTSFNTTGKVITAIGSHGGTSVVALQPDGKIVIAGTCWNGSNSNSDFCLARYLPSGALDTSFNTTGKVITGVGSGNDYANALAVQPDGTIVAAGACFNGNTFDFCLARYLPSGALDTTFNTTGSVITPIGARSDTAYALALQPDGKIV